MRRNMPVSEAAEQLGCSRGTVLNLIARGAITAYRYGGGRSQLWISQESIDLFLEASREPATEANAGSAA